MLKSLPNKCMLSDLGKLSPFSRCAAKKPPAHPSRKCRRYSSQKGVTMSFRLWAVLFLILPCFVNASFIGPNGLPIPETEYRKTDGGFGAELVVTHDEKEALKNWNTESEGVYFPTTDVFHKGKIITALLVFKGCEKLENNHCQLSQKFRIYQPDGKIYGDLPETELWFNRESPPGNTLGLGADYLRLIVEPDGQLGKYTFEVIVKDYQSKKEIKLTKTIEVVE